jgi:hypothetical protein
MAQLMLFCFANISAENLLHILGYSFCTERYCLAYIHQTLMPLKESTFICTKPAQFGCQTM